VATDAELLALFGELPQGLRIVPLPIVGPVISKTIERCELEDGDGDG